MAAEEMVDILDEFCAKTGKVLPKSQVHAEGLRHGGAHVWIYNSRGEMLLQLRSKDKEIYGGAWDISAAGHLSAGDTPIDAALRETEEELGITLAPADLRFIGINRTDMPIAPRNWVHHVFDWNYIACVDKDASEFAIQAEELDAVAWKHLDVFEAEVHDAELGKNYSPRMPYLYDLAIYEIRKAIAEKQGKKFAYNQEVL